MRSKPIDPRLRALLDSDPAMTDRILRVFAAPPSALVSSPGAAAAHLAPLLAGHATERFAVLALNRRNRVIASEVLTIGTDGYVVVDVPGVLRFALKHGAHAVIVAHNHPSGDPTPSEPDREVTRRLVAGFRAIGVKLYDHVVVTDASGFCSLADDGMLPRWSDSMAFTGEI